MLATWGPLHTHRAPAAIVVLDDLRRGSAPMSPSAAARAAERHGHAHGTALRHHHDVGDASVELADGAALGDGDEGAAALAALVASAPASAGVAAAGAGDVAATRLAWVPRTHAPAPFERPPRSV